MGFLDRMISDLIQDNTGFNARRLVRKIGGGKLLAMGGAALAAGIFAEKQSMLGGQGVTPQQPAAPPPSLPGRQTSPGQQAPPPPIPGSQPAMPPIPGSKPATPPPPVPGGEAPAETSAEAPDEELPPELTYAIVRTMVAAALADGHLAPEEKAIIEKHLGESDLSEDQKAQIHQDLALPPPIDKLAAMTADGPAREVLYRFGALVVLADQHTSDLERSWLKRLAAAFEFGDERTAALEAEIFLRDDD